MSVGETAMIQSDRKSEENVERQKLLEILLTKDLKEISVEDERLPYFLWTQERFALQMIYLKAEYESEERTSPGPICHVPCSNGLRT